MESDEQNHRDETVKSPEPRHGSESSGSDFIKTTMPQGRLSELRSLRWRWVWVRTAVTDLGGIWRKANGVEKIHSEEGQLKVWILVVAFCSLGD